MTVTAGPNGRPSCLDGRYRLIDQLGRGGTASVWRAYDERLGRTVAVKLLHPAAHAQGSRAEAQALARLSHPHIANVFDYGGDDGDGDGQPYLVMELVQGRSLAAALADDDLSWPAVVAAVAQVTSALAAAHERGLVHRDVTPANIMLTPSGAKLIDFGISAVEGQDEADPDGGLRGRRHTWLPNGFAARRSPPHPMSTHWVWSCTGRCPDACPGGPAMPESSGRYAR